eukprot:gnl/MRDRNA2_/MRDRNA2_32152_c0_seq1.p1 gnl/MRDRNA2_/MRDRNA2_32152_c0~~gnl/MRDRNA2_/MRDRNA2_32152_c0_seq1.p1  ORF type:complete len:723 (+),score=181.41 gnl/MRDRNA2_/MRDRNA2_32152_c0_seq1:104-2272(+)
MRPGKMDNKTLLDSLMGADRNAGVNDKKQSFKDKDICKYFLVWDCPHTWFVNQQGGTAKNSPLGPCKRQHSVAMQERLKADKEHEKYRWRYLSKVQQVVAKVIVEVDGKVARNKEMMEAGRTSGAHTYEALATHADERKAVVDEKMKLAERWAEIGQERKSDEVIQEAGALAATEKRLAGIAARAQVWLDEVCDVCGTIMSWRTDEELEARKRNRAHPHVVGSWHVGISKVRQAAKDLDKEIKKLDFDESWEKSTSRSKSRSKSKKTEKRKMLKSAGRRSGSREGRKTQRCKGNEKKRSEEQDTSKDHSRDGSLPKKEADFKKPKQGHGDSRKRKKESDDNERAESSCIGQEEETQRVVHRRYVWGAEEAKDEERSREGRKRSNKKGNKVNEEKKELQELAEEESKKKKKNSEYQTPAAPVAMDLSFFAPKEFPEKAHGMEENFEVVGLPKKKFEPLVHPDNVGACFFAHADRPGATKALVNPSVPSNDPSKAGVAAPTLTTVRAQVSSVMPGTMNPTVPATMAAVQETSKIAPLGPQVASLGPIKSKTQVAGQLSQLQQSIEQRIGNFMEKSGLKEQTPAAPNPSSKPLSKMEQIIAMKAMQEGKKTKKDNHESQRIEIENKRLRIEKLLQDNKALATSGNAASSEGEKQLRQTVPDPFAIPSSYGVKAVAPGKSRSPLRRGDSRKRRARSDSRRRSRSRDRRVAEASILPPQKNNKSKKP